MTQYDQDHPCSGTTTWDESGTTVNTWSFWFAMNSSTCDLSWGHQCLPSMPWWKQKARTNISMAWSSESLAQDCAEIVFKPTGSAECWGVELKQNPQFGHNRVERWEDSQKNIQMFFIHDYKLNMISIWNHYEEMYCSFALFHLWFVYGLFMIQLCVSFIFYCLKRNFLYNYIFDATIIYIYSFFGQPSIRAMYKKNINTIFKKKTVKNINKKKHKWKTHQKRV